MTMPHAMTDDTSMDEARSITYGRLTVDMVGYTVTVAGRDVPLTLSEFLLLKALMLKPYHSLDRERLMQVLHSRQVTNKRGWNPAAPRAIDLHMSRIRRKLAMAGYDCIKTMRFVGYRFVPVSDDGAPERQSSSSGR
jgi:DNA-binding response OmpR family regulator